MVPLPTLSLRVFPTTLLTRIFRNWSVQGYRVAICDQLEDPKLTKTIVKRGVTELITPGVTDNDKILDHKSNNFLCALHFDHDVIGISFLDISTGEFYAAQGNADYTDKLLQGFKPTEIIFCKSRQKDFRNQFGTKYYTYAIDDWVFQQDYTNDLLVKQFETQSLKGFGIGDLLQAIVACGAALHYLQVSEHPNISHITGISRIEEERYVWLDRFTVRNLEILGSNQEGGKSLLQVLDHTLSPMGARMLRKWIVLPLKEIQPITERHDLVELIIKDPELSKQLSVFIRQIGDLERLIARVALGKISPREIVQIKKALTSIGQIRLLLSGRTEDAFKKIADQLIPVN
jgi:DNA mismatch repair protein MutS